MLSPGMRIVSVASIALGAINCILLIIGLLTRTPEQAEEGVYLTYALMTTQLGMIAVGVGLLRLYRLAWIAFWFVGLVALVFAAEQTRWLEAQRGELQSVAFFVGVGLTLWFVASAICMVLPSSRKFYFNEPDQIWMHKKVFRAQENAITSVSGRPRKSVGVNILACLAVVFATLVFVYAMAQLAEADPEGFDAPPRLPVGWVATLILFSVATVVASVGLLRTRRWGWYGGVACGMIAILLAALLAARPTMPSVQNRPAVGTGTFLLCVLWCGAGVLFLFLPNVRRPFFSRGRRHHRTG
jgi:hypothetical protein